ncbi:aspartate--tRNA ligase [soil metagenome]
MREHLVTALRTRGAGTLGAADVGTQVVLCGWVHRRRDHGGLVFIDLRDRYGIIQCVASPERLDPVAYRTMERLRAEDVVQIEGMVAARPPESVNAELQTGGVEVELTGARLLNPSEVPPFPVDVEKEGGEVAEEMRLRYRFLELRRLHLTAALGMRHRLALETRRYLDEQGFWEIETPILTRRTPEGARDYLVPSRVHPGKFYALPQSPQLYKQLLMVAGYDRYFQIARCFRDEDLRADRQPEFTQIDLEMAFVEQADVLRVVEGLMGHLFQVCLGVEIGAIPRLTHSEAMARFGSDKPDLRIPHELVDVGEPFAGSGFRVINRALETGGSLVALRVPGGAGVSRSVLDRWTEAARTAGAGGLVWARLTNEGWSSSADKFVETGRWERAGGLAGVQTGDLLLLAADHPRTARSALGALRVQIARERGWIDEKTPWRPVWIVDFPLFEPGEEGRPAPSHHPFTAPRGGLAALDARNPLGIAAEAYDLVLNGYELGSGSIRIHERAVQERVFEILGMERSEVEEKFGFLLRAFEYGAPPHGGIALGLDRIAMLFVGALSLREVIAFPKTTSASALLEGSPSDVDEAQLAELHLGTVEEQLPGKGSP